jgi:aminoglycoside phosphotransferase (APT) family kinase protein
MREGLSAGRLHADDIDIDDALVRELLDAQHPPWAQLPLRRVPSSGTSNILYRLGDDMVVRLPRTPRSAAEVRKEQRWLPRLASALPLQIPPVFGTGMPTSRYSHPWSVYGWLEGQNAGIARFANPSAAAEQMGEFVRALRRIDSADGPLPGNHNFHRGVPLIVRDEEMRQVIPTLPAWVDRSMVEAEWQAALDAPAWNEPPVWVHGDLLPSNLLVQGAELTAVIDFGGLTVGDPATDLLPAWSIFSGAARDRFREVVDVDDGTWMRGRGWALSVGVIALPYYEKSNPALVELTTKMIRAVLTASDG